MCVESARPIRSANGRVPGDRDFASCTPAEAWDARPILSGCRVWAPVIFPADLAIHPATLDCLPVVFFQPIASPRTSECHIGSPVWFLNRRPTHLHAEHLEKKKGRIPKDGDSKTLRNSQGSCRQAKIQRIGTRPAGCATSVRSADARTRKSADPGDCEKTDLAVNFRLLASHTRAAEGRPARGGRYCSERRLRTVE